MKYLFYLCLFLALHTHAQNNINWEAEIMVTDGTMGNNHPRIGLDGNENPVIIWGHDENVHFTKWNGSNFTSPLMLDPMDMSIFTASWAGPDLAAKGDTIYVVYKENPEDAAPVYCVHSYDGGVTFSEPVIVDAMIGDNISRFPSVTVNDTGQPIVAFMKLDSDFGNAQYVVSTSDDFGNNFNMDVLASNFSSGEVCDCCPVGVTAHEDYVATLYRDNLENLRNSWAGISINGGAMFMNGIQIDQTDWIINTCPSSGPDGVIINDSLYSVFMSAAEGDSRVYFSESSLTEFSDNPDLRLTEEFTGLSLQNFPRIANYGTAAAIVWKQNVNTESEIAILFTENITQGFPTLYESVVYLDYYGLENADVAVSSTDVHVVWQDNYTDMVMYRKGSYAEPVAVDDKINNSIIHVYPNPVLNEIHISAHSSAIFKDILMYDLYGKMVSNKFLLSGDDYLISTSYLPLGIYEICITDDEGNNFTTQIVKN